MYFSLSTRQHQHNVILEQVFPLKTRVIPHEQLPPKEKPQRHIYTHLT